MRLAELCLASQNLKSIPSATDSTDGRRFATSQVAMQINLMMGFAKVAAIVVVMFFVLDSYGRVILLYISTIGV